MHLMMIMIGIAHVYGHYFSILETFLCVCLLVYVLGFEVIPADVILFHGAGTI